jgi:hypothetical protein
MTYKEFGENADIIYKIIIVVNDELAIDMDYYSLDSLIEDSRKFDRAVESTLESQYYDLPDPDYK